MGAALRAHDPADWDARHVTSQGALHSGAQPGALAPQSGQPCQDFCIWRSSVYRCCTLRLCKLQCLLKLMKTLRLSLRRAD